MAPHAHDLGPFRHSHAFADAGLRRRERALTLVTLITLAAMALELGVGWWSGSLALLADGWHMGTHALALGGAVLAYRLSARAARHGGYAFGGWKIEVLTAYTSGLALLLASGWIAFDAIDRLREPQPIAFTEAIVVAVFGLAVNIVCAWLLARGTHGETTAQAHAHPGHAHAHGHPRHDHDQNFSAAYLHVIADAFTSVLAITALAGGLWFGWNWLDAAVALVGAAVISQWALGVLRSSVRRLTDATADPAISERIRQLLEADGDAKVSDLHVWQVGAQAWCAALAVVADRPRPALDYRRRLAAIEPLRHVTVEVHPCPGPHAAP